MMASDVVIMMKQFDALIVARYKIKSVVQMFSIYVKKCQSSYEKKKIVIEVSDGINHFV